MGPLGSARLLESSARVALSRLHSLQLFGVDAHVPVEVFGDVEDGCVVHRRLVVVASGEDGDQPAAVH
eukprot:615972-Pleurochrysis_carterae.AAC.1